MNQFGLTLQQRKCLDFIEQYVAENRGVSPSFYEIAVGIGYTAHGKGNVHRLVHGLIDRGYLAQLSPRAKRSLRVVRREAKAA